MIESCRKEPSNQMAVESLADIRVQDFAGCVDKPFDVALEENGAPAIQLTLVSVAEHGQPVGPAGRAPFSLTFEGASEVPLEQGTYWFTRTDFGTHGVFIVPIGEKGNTRTYEAIFS